MLQKIFSGHFCSGEAGCKTLLLVVYKTSLFQAVASLIYQMIIGGWIFFFNLPDLVELRLKLRDTIFLIFEKSEPRFLVIELSDDFKKELGN